MSASPSSIHKKDPESPSAEHLEVVHSTPQQRERIYQEKGIGAEQKALYESFAAKSPEWHIEKRKALVRRIDWRLLPLLAIMYTLNFLDRNNLSQARLGTLEEDLGMKGTDFNLATSILFVGYLLMQLPSNLILTRTRPSLYLGCAMAVWGMVSALQSTCQSFKGLVVARFFLGFVEAPYFPGAVMLLSSWYTKGELAQRIAWFYSGNALANAFGGLIGAGVLGNLEGARGIAGWRWLFIIEGTITVFVAACSTYILPNFPANTTWLSEEDRHYAEYRLIDDAGEADVTHSASIFHAVILAIKDPRLYIFILLQHSVVLGTTFQYFFPSIVDTLGFGKVETLLLTVPVWILAFAASIFVTWNSGRTQDRCFHLIVLMIVSLVGNIIAVATTVPGVRYFAMFLMPLGVLPAYSIVVAWVATSFPRPLPKRSAAIAIANAFANLASVYGSYMWPSTDAPRYIPGGSANVAVLIVVCVVAWATRMWHVRINRELAEKEVLGEDGRVVENRHAGDEDARAVGFRYPL